MERRHGLGRGLGALLGEQPRPREDGLRQLPIELIDANPQQPRRTFNQDALTELELSIRELGVLVPIIVRSRGERFELIAGERRLRASKAAGLSFVPALVRDADDQASLELAVVENLQREDLDPIEEAMGFSDLVRDYGFTQERLATRLGKSRPAIANAMRLLDLGDEIKAFVHRRELTAGHARAILALPADERLALAKRAIKESLTVRDIERLARKQQMPVVTGEFPRRKVSPDRDDAEDRLRRRLATPVRIVGGKRGYLEIGFADEEDLTRIVELLLSE